MGLRFRILAASRAPFVRDTRAGSPGFADGPVAERAVDLAPEVTELRIGRQRGAEIELPFPAVSSLHARIGRGELPTDWLIEDLGSRNGTWLDGQRLSPHQPATLRPGQRLRIATVDITFEGWSTSSEDVECTATIARRLISDLFGVVAGGEAPTLSLESGPAVQAELRLTVVDRRYLAGRGESCDLMLACEHVSREHAAFVRRADGVAIFDIGSKNGLLVNGLPVSRQAQLHDGDRITFGKATLCFTDPADRYLRRLESADRDRRDAQPDAPARRLSAPLSPALETGARISTPTLDSSPRAGPATTRPPSLPRLPMGRSVAVLAAVVAVLAVGGLLALWLATR